MEEGGSSSMFEGFVVLGKRGNYHSAALDHVQGERASRGTVVEQPEVLFRYPADAPLPEQLGDFCFPQGLSVQVLRRTPSMSALNEVLFGQLSVLHSTASTFVLHFDHGAPDRRLYAACIVKSELVQQPPVFLLPSLAEYSHSAIVQRRQYYLVANRCYCLLSRRPLFQVHFAFLVKLLSQDRIMKLDVEALLESPGTSSEQMAAYQAAVAGNFRAVLERYRSVAAAPGASVAISVRLLPDAAPAAPAPASAPVVAAEAASPLVAPSAPAADVLEATLPDAPTDDNGFVEWVMLSFFRYFSLDQGLFLLRALLLERSVVVSCDNVGVLSAIVLSLSALVAPMRWQGLCIPILPDAMVDYLDAPVPYVMGVARLPARRALKDDAILVFPLEGRVLTKSVLPELPEEAKLRRNLARLHHALHSSPQRNQNAFHAPSAERATLKVAVDHVRRYVRWLLERLRACVSDACARLSVSVERALTAEHRAAVKSAVSAGMEARNLVFISEFYDTQQFQSEAERNAEEKN